MCMVSVDGSPKAVTACNTYVEEGLNIITENYNIFIHQLNVALIFIETWQECRSTSLFR